MRTVIALLLLAVATQAYQAKTGGLKGSWATDIVVLGPDVDMVAPTVSNFEIDGEAADYMWNASDPSGTQYPFVLYDSSDASDAVSSIDHSCSFTFDLWDDAGNVLSTMPSDYNQLYIAYYYWQGTYEATIMCSDMTGNMGWWDSATTATIYGLNYYNHEPDMTAFDLSAFNLEGSATASLTYTLTDAGSSMSYDVTVDFDRVSPNVNNDLTYAAGVTVGYVWTPMVGSSVTSSWDGSCDASYTGGSCYVTISLTRYSEPGVYAFTTAMVWDAAGNMASTTGLTATLTVMDDPQHTLTVVSCQTVVMTVGALTPDVSLGSDEIDLTVGCTIKSDLTLATNSVYLMYQRDQLLQYNDNGVSTFPLGGVVGNNYADFTSLLSDGTLSTSVDLTYGFPEGPYRLESLTTQTSYGMTQFYTYDLGSASTAAPSVLVAVVLAAVALLRL